MLFIGATNAPNHSVFDVFVEQFAKCSLVERLSARWREDLAGSIGRSPYESRGPGGGSRAIGFRGQRVSNR